MTGTSEPIREPTDNAEWAREQKRKTEALEHPTSTRAGEWVLSTSDEGHLIASNVNGGSVILARKPPDGENNPDDIQDDTTPGVCLIRSASQSIPTTGAVVIFDGVRFETGGDWTGGRKTPTAVTVPVSGNYLVTGTVQWATGGSAMTSIIRVDEKTRLAGRTYDAGQDQWPTSTVVGMLALDAGQAVDLFAYCGLNRTIGAATLYGNPVPCELSIVLVERT